MDDCIFCAIAASRAPASIVYQDETSVAFLDIHPIARGHTLIIPREHCADLFDLTNGAGEAVIRAAAKVARALRSELKPDGLNMLQSNGRAAGQTVFHFHFHLVPRWRNDGLFLPRHALAAADRSELAELATVLRQRL